MRASIFVCSYCGRTISRSALPFGMPEPPRNVCSMCHWINTNENLLDEEREPLRKKLCQ